MEKKKTKSTERTETFYEVKLHPLAGRCDQVTVYPTLGALLRQTRLRRDLSLRKAAFNAGLSPMYLSLLERDACGPPSDGKLQALAQALGEQAGTLFAKAGRVPPRVADIILRNPAEWSALIEASKELNSVQIERLKDTILAGLKREERPRSNNPTPKVPYLRQQGEERAGQRRPDVNVDVLKSIVGLPGGSAAIRREQLKAIVETAEIEEQSRKDAVFERKVGRLRS
jgi:transcriptional regulator with XRE-family HTH domain